MADDSAELQAIANALRLVFPELDAILPLRVLRLIQADAG